MARLLVGAEGAHFRYFEQFELAGNITDKHQGLEQLLVVVAPGNLLVVHSNLLVVPGYQFGSLLERHRMIEHHTVLVTQISLCPSLQYFLELVPLTWWIRMSWWWVVCLHITRLVVWRYSMIWLPILNLN